MICREEGGKICRRKLMKKNWIQLREVMRGVMEWRGEGNEGVRGTNL